MGILIEGRFPPFKKEAEQETSPVIPIQNKGLSREYPWHILVGPPGTKPAEVNKMIVELSRLAELTFNGGVLQLPHGWFFDFSKNQQLIGQLLQIGTQEIPDEIA